jgi:cell fate regulator YaaT (PSP1 superfamily)
MQGKTDSTMTTGNPIYRGCATGKHAGTCAKLDVFNWLSDVENKLNPEDIVEIRFKNTRKDYYYNINKLQLEVGDLVALEASPGHDIGMVSLVGDLVIKQMRRHKVTYVNGELRKVYRKAKPVDVEKWEAAMRREHETMIHSRQITEDLKLNMKIGDVEYQGDGTKAIFYYIADERVDFRQLIKVLADTFRIRVEMKQIGARQEAGRIGGIGPCGRELCCCTWMSNFSSVTTSAARYQEISLNPQKLAGQCSKLKCCLNYEVDSYLDAQKDFPPTNVKLETQEGNFLFIKSDVYKRTFWYTLDSNSPSGQIGIPVERVHDIIKMNRRGQKPEKLLNPGDSPSQSPKPQNEYGNVVGQDSLTRFDKPKGEGGRNRRPNRRPEQGQRGMHPGARNAQPNQGEGQDVPNQTRTKPELNLKTTNEAATNEERPPLAEGDKPQRAHQHPYRGRRNFKRGQ